MLGNCQHGRYGLAPLVLGQEYLMYRSVGSVVFVFLLST